MVEIQAQSLTQLLRFPQLAAHGLNARVERSGLLGNRVVNLL